MSFEKTLKNMYSTAITLSLGSSFHSLGPAYLNERSPNVIRLLKEGLLSKSVSSEFVRLYFEAGFSSTSSDI